ncbi:MscL family protein [Metamycoplasma canadense]|uniref:Large-conductance mechanosensitive channel n=1 Tax=Metamycoplasma canadense TaxID=29554 RepID=A0A077LBI7_9BACT|nr:MscL family protein [Metamycoplasma canadense]BAP39489.1 large-conductance mechanosensitive channel [Metamycoplasma canadense]
MTKKELVEKKKYFKKSFSEAKSVLKRGNIFMLAIGLLLGASFGAVVSSLANDVIMASISKMFGKASVEELKIGGTILIGKFLAALIQFAIVSAFVFISLFLFYLIKHWIEYQKAKKMPIEEEIVEEIKPTIDEQILDQLKKLNKKVKEISKK